MSINELYEMVNDTRDLLVENYKKEYKKTPTEDDLVSYIKDLYKEKLQDDLIDSLCFYDINFEKDFFKLLFLFASKRK
ncbi:hypothetical protein EBU91_02720 [bacterium]|nr:hypothetical protein [bacterium]